MICPVCTHKNQSELTATCTNCGSDLMLLTLMDTVEDQYVDTLKESIATDGELLELKKQYKADIEKSQSRFNKLILAVLLLPLLGLIFGRYSNKKVDPTMAEATPSSKDEAKIVLTNDTDSLDFYRSRVKELELQVEAFDATKVRDVEYVIKEGDQLGDLGTLFFNNWRAGYQIGQDNGYYDTRSLRKGDTLTINFR